MKAARFPRSELLFALDMGGTFVLAVEGALAGIAGHLDLFGVAVVAFATALGGGIVRDLLIGATPPASLRDWRYSAVAFGGALVSMVFALANGSALPPFAEIIDAAGLSLVAIAGAEKGLEFKVPPVVAILLGVVSGVGGGTLRDILLARVPVVLHADFYASAALIGAALMVGCRSLNVPTLWAAGAGGFVCFGLRLAAIGFHWGLPILGR